MTAATKPAFHHVNLKTTRLQEMIDWYGTVAGRFAPERSPVQIPSEG
jgi:hypothetical protein